MDGDRRNWPVIVGVAAGVLTGMVAGIYFYSSRSDCIPNTKLHDAADIIAQCREKIKEIEVGLESLKNNTEI